VCHPCNRHGITRVVMDMDVSTHMVMFDTALGRCAVRWSDMGITRVLLPGGSVRPGSGSDDDIEPPPFVRRAIEGMTALLAGEPADLRTVRLDDRNIDEFRRAVYAATQEVAPGSTRTYGQIARAIGHPAAARDVGAALARNPFPIVVPCHRVVGANGALTGFSAPGGLATKRRMLELEGAPGFGQQRLFD
jgi:methylated-DNA-[protein]-cysteine S-methyltransferase